jgi:hypothetical protein
MFSKRNIFIMFVLIFVILSLSSCMPGQDRQAEKGKAGFFWGIWHGWIAPVSLIFGFFNDNIRIYETNNTGWWYDFGYYIAVIGGFGGISLIRRKAKKD